MALRDIAFAGLGDTAPRHVDRAKTHSRDKAVPFALTFLLLVLAAFSLGLGGSVFRHGVPRPHENEVLPGLAVQVTTRPIESSPITRQTSEVPTGAPVVAPEQETYVVQPGDNLTRIAQRFQTTPDTLIQLNGLSSPNNLRPGQRLFLPGRTSRP